MEESEEPPSLSLRDFLSILRRRRAIAINTFILVVALGIAVTLMTKPVYRTSASLMVQGTSRSVTIGSNDNPLSTIFQAKPGRDIDTQIEILRSSQVLDRVFKEAGLAPGSAAVDVRRVGQTDFIQLTVTSTSKDAAEAFAKAMPKVYQQDTRSDIMREVTAALSFAQSSLRDENNKLHRTEKALERYNERNRVTGDINEVKGAIEASVQSQSDLVRVESIVASSLATLNTLRDQRRGLPASLSSPVTVTNPQLQVLRDQIATLNSERQSRLHLYKPDQDEVRQVDAQIADFQNRLANAPATITTTSTAPNPAVETLEAKIRDAQANLDAARESLGPLREQATRQNRRVGGFNVIQLQQAQLLRDRDSSAAASKSLSENVGALTLKQKALEAAGAPVVIMEAAGPAAKIAPRMSRNLMMALFLGALLAAGAALLQESLDDHIRDEDEARRLLRTPILGYFGQVAPGRQKALLNLESPDRILLENFRVLRSNVQFTLVNTPGRKLQVTSSVPGEGKSYIASNLAIAMALDGRRVVLVDADLHRPTMHTVFDLPRQPGLTNVLVGSVRLLDSLQDVGIPNLRVLSAGATPPNPVELLNSPAMDAVMEMLEREADVVIFDTPPLLATADSQVMSSKVDGVIYVMQLGLVPRSSIQRSFELLQQAQARVAGMVFNRVEEQQRTSYDNYGSYYDSPDDEDGATTAIPSGDPSGDGINSLLKSAKRFLPTPRSDENGSNGAANGVNGAGNNGHGAANGSANGFQNGDSSHAAHQNSNGDPANGTFPNGTSAPEEVGAASAQSPLNQGR